MIWVIGGTSDALKLADLLLHENKNVLVTTTTNYGSSLAKKDGLTVIQKMLNVSKMITLLQENSIEWVIDASHPYANEVSENAIKACGKQDVKYTRFEREKTVYKNARYYADYSSLVDALQSSEGNILLTVGSKNIHVFNAISRDRLVARVLPVRESIAKCEEAGLKAHQVIAMKGRMSKETNKALLLEYDISHLVTKDSGDAGGLAEKVEAAKQAGVAIHILQRPKVEYPETYNNYNDIIKNIR